MHRTTKNSIRRINCAARGGLALLALALGAFAPLAYGQADPDVATTRPTDAGDVITELPAERVIPLYAGESRLINAPWPVKRVVVNNPNVADVEAGSPKQVHIRAIAPGVSDFVMFGAEGQVWRARIEVEADLSKLQSQLTKLFPQSELEVSQVGEVTAVSGQLARAEQAAQLREFLERSGMEYLDLTRVAGVQQVQLKVRVAEVSRNAMRNLSVDAAITDGSLSFALNNAGSGTYEPGTPAGQLNRSLPGGTTIFGTGTLDDYVFEYFLQALAENQYLRLLAEPTLVALSGQEASFLAGGEFPVPIAELGEGSTTAISIEYREFGVRLTFRPVVLGDAMIRLEVIPEVSELSDVGAVDILGTRVPSLLTRRVQTTLELESGQTFGIAGLISSNHNARSSRIPGLGDLPVLGALFRSVRHSTAETELVILVTASLVEPQSTPIEDIPLPGAGLQEPSAWELYALGRIEGHAPAKLSDADAQGLRELGLDQLNGPGTWASYDDAPPATARAKSAATTTESSDTTER